MHFHFLRNHSGYKKQNKSCSSPSETHRLALDVRRRQDGRSLVWRIYSICIHNCVQFTNSLFHNLVRLTAAGGHIAVVLQGRAEHGGDPDGPPLLTTTPPSRTWQEEKKTIKDDTHLSDCKKETWPLEKVKSSVPGSWFLITVPIDCLPKIQTDPAENGPEDKLMARSNFLAAACCFLWNHLSRRYFDGDTAFFFFFFFLMKATLLKQFLVHNAGNLLLFGPLVFGGVWSWRRVASFGSDKVGRSLFSFQRLERVNSALTTDCLLIFFFVFFLGEPLSIKF